MTMIDNLSATCCTCDLECENENQREKHMMETGHAEFNFKQCSKSDYQKAMKMSSGLDLTGLRPRYIYDRPFPNFIDENHCEKSLDGKHQWTHVIFYKFCKHCDIGRKRTELDWRTEEGIGVFHLH